MKMRMRGLLAAMLTVLTLSVTALPASAAVQTQDSAVSQQARTPVSADNFLPDSVAKKRVTAITRLSDEQVEEISGRLAEHSNVYLVELQDGYYTYYMTVDFRDDDAVYFSKLAVMRATSHKLHDRSVAMAAEDKPAGEPLLMSYPHILGELSLHYIGYRFTDALGGEKLPGLLGKVYRSCIVADLNVDEGRLAAMIRILGRILG